MVSNKFRNVLSEEQCNHHEVSLHRARLANGSRGVKKTACLALSRSRFPPGISSTLQNAVRVPRNSRMKDVLLPVVWNKCVFHHFWSDWKTTQSVPELLVDNIWISCYLSSIQFWSYCCLAESDEFNDLSENYFALSCAKSLEASCLFHGFPMI